MSVAVSSTSQCSPKLAVREAERDVLGVRVDQQQERVVAYPLTARVGLGDRVAVEEDRRATWRSRCASRRRSSPRRTGSARRCRACRRAPASTALEEPPAPEDRVVAAQPGQRPDELQPDQVRPRPSAPRRARCPGSRRCCCPAGCGRARRRATASARPGTGTAWRGSCASAWRAARSDPGSLGRALGAAVPGAVVVGAVAVVLAVGLVVLAVVGDQVGEGEPVVAGHEVDRGDRAAAAVRVQVAGAGQPGGELGQRACSPRQKSRTVSRYLPFHSVHSGGKLPTW